MDVRVGPKEGWAPKNWCFWTVMLEKTLESPLDCKEIKPVNPKGNQPWIFTGRTDAEAQAPVLWPPNAKSWLTGKDLMLGKIEGKRRRGQQRMRWLVGITDFNGHESKQTPGCSEAQGSLLACCSPWDRRVAHDLVTEQQQWQILITIISNTWLIKFYVCVGTHML